MGKSQVVAQAAQALGRALTDIRAVLLDPVDLRGLPAIGDDGRSHWRPPAFLPREGTGVLFLDELNAAPPLVQAACYQLILDRRLGEYALPDGWSVVAAGNREQDRAVTHRMPSALANRMVHLDFEPHLEDWLAWAENAAIRPEVTAFVRFRPALLPRLRPFPGRTGFPLPAHLGVRLGHPGRRPVSEVEYDLFRGTVGEGAAAEFSGFLRSGASSRIPRRSWPIPGRLRFPPSRPRSTPSARPWPARPPQRPCPPWPITPPGSPWNSGSCSCATPCAGTARIAGTEAFAAWARDNAHVLV